MNKLKYTFKLAAVLALLVLGLKVIVACNNASNAATTNNNALSGSVNYLFVMNQGSEDLHSHAFNDTTGAVGSAGNHTATANQPNTEALEPNGKFLFAGDSGGVITSYSINTSGNLTALGSPTTASPSAIQSLAVDSQGRFLVAVDNNSSIVYSYKINSSTGLLTAANSLTETNTNPNSVIINPTGTYAYAADVGTQMVTQYSIDQTTGNIAQVGSPVSTSTPSSLAVAPSGNYLYAVSAANRSIQAFSFSNTGAPVTVGSPASTSGNGAPTSFVVDPSSKFAYVVTDNGSYRGFTIQNDGSLAAIGSSFATLPGSNPIGTMVSVDPADRFVYFMDSANSTVDVYSLNSTTGVLTAVNGSPFSVCFNIMYGILGNVP